MIFIADSEIDRFLLEDIALGDLTTRNLGIASQYGHMTYTSRNASVASGIGVARRVLQKLELEIIDTVADGQSIQAGQTILTAQGNAAALHQGWKVAQNILEWSCGVAQATSSLLALARKENPHVHIACTRKSIPGTRLLAVSAVLDGGGIIHRMGTAETVLLFANHRRFFSQPFNWTAHVRALRDQAPEKKIVVEADTPEEAIEAMQAEPDIIQLDKFTPEQIASCLNMAQKGSYRGTLIAAGGINLNNVQAYAATGVPVLVTSSPYYAKPADIGVKLTPSVSV